MGKKNKEPEELFKNMMQNGRLRDYTKTECHYIINEWYGNSSLELIDMLLRMWSGKHPTQQHFREALNEIKRKRGVS